MALPRATEHPIDTLFTRRWSPRAFTGEPIDEATLSDALRARESPNFRLPLSAIVADGRFSFER